MKGYSIIIALGAMALAAPAAAQPRLKAHAFTGGGGTSSGGGIQHFSATGVGMAVGRNSGGGISAQHGFLAGTSRGRDEEAPVIIDLPNIDRGTVVDRCVGIVDLPAVDVTDNRDRNPVVTVTLSTVPEQDIDPAGEQVELAPGSYDVLITARDRYDNVSQSTYRVDVHDNVAPVVQLNGGEPTPVGGEAEATSPAGTQVVIDFGCVDACDPAPTASRDPVLARYTLGDTGVALGCQDASNNNGVANVTVRVRDTSGPVMDGNLPAAINRECNSPLGAIIPVPQIAWRDLGYNADQLSVTLVLDPAGVAQAYDPIPNEITLRRGLHVLRYTALDPAGNTTNVDVNVQVDDNGVPSLRVVEAPANGWFAGQNAQVVLQVADGCSEPGDGLVVDVVPAPDNQQLVGDRLTLTYSQEGIYQLAITAEDADGNQTRDNSIAFGIDRRAPDPVVVSPTQAGVVANDPGTWPIFAQAERLNLNLGGEEAADGTFSGVARVDVFIDPDGQRRIISAREFDPVGQPPRGDRAVANVGCEQVGADCTNALEMELRALPVGNHQLEIVVTDFAGNISSSRARFRTMDLTTGLDEARLWSEDMLNAGIAQAAVRTRLQQARAGFIAGRDMNDIRLNTPYNTPRFLGGSLVYVQQAAAKLDTAINAAQNAGEQARLVEIADLMERVALSDLTLMAQHVNGLPASNDPVVDTERVADMRLANQALDLFAQDIAGEAWNQGAGNALLAFFHLKSALSGWMMNYRYEPNLADDAAILVEYARGRDILLAVRDELTQYLTLESKPAEANVRTIRDRLNAVLDDLDTLVQHGFDGNGLSDHDYTISLMELRDVANFSGLATGQNAYMRNYQFSMIQVVRYMTQTSMADAVFNRGGGRANWPIYTAGFGYVDDGVDLLDQRQVQAVIDLYGTEEDPACLLAAVYHCDYLDDDGGAGVDQDQPLDDALVPDFCWDRMYRPGEWAAAQPDGQIPPRCVWGNVQR
jgi:hypothetical protein